MGSCAGARLPSVVIRRRRRRRLFFGALGTSQLPTFFPIFLMHACGQEGQTQKLIRTLTKDSRPAALSKSNSIQEGYSSRIVILESSPRADRCGNGKLLPKSKQQPRWRGGARGEGVPNILLCVVANRACHDRHGTGVGEHTQTCSLRKQ